MHNFTFKDINSRPIISSIKFYISFSLPIFYIFPLTTNNNHNKTNKTLTTEASKSEISPFFTPQFFIRLLIYFLFFVMLCPNETNSELFYFNHFCSVR